MLVLQLLYKFFIKKYNEIRFYNYIRSNVAFVGITIICSAFIMKWVVIVVLIGAFLSETSKGQRIPPPPQSFLNSLNNPSQNGSGFQSSSGFQQQQKQDELANIKDENIKRVLVELSTLQTPSQRSETMARVALLVGPLFFTNYDQRKDQISPQSRDPSTTFPQRLLSAVTDIQGEEVKALLLQKKLDTLHAGDFAFLPLAMQYGFQDEILRNLSGSKLAAVVKANPGDTVVAFKVSSALFDQRDQQIEFLQSLGPKLLPEVQRIIMRRLLEWWGDSHQWKDRQLNLLIAAGSPLLSFMPQSELESFDDELADRFVSIMGQAPDIARGWWRKPMSLKKSWFEVAKGARYFGGVHEWSFRRMQKLSFLLEGASPEDLQLIPPIQEIKSFVIGNHYTELQARVVFDAFYNKPPLTQEDLQEYQFHILDLMPAQLQRFDFADSFGTLDEMLSILERQRDPAYPTVLQISYFMWPIVNATNSVMNIAPPSTWQKRELSQIGKFFFLLPKSVLSQMKPDILDWDSNILSAIKSNHLTQFQIWKITNQILNTVDDRFKPEYIFMIPSPFQKGIPTHNISQALLGTTTVRPEILRALIEETSGMLMSQKSVILQRISNRISEALIIKMMIGTMNPAEMFNLISPKILNKNMGAIIKTVMEIPEMGRFGITSIQVKLLPRKMLSLWLKWVRENAQVAQWSAEDLFGRSPMGATHELNLAILGLGCRDIENIDPWDALAVIMHYRHELYSLRRFKPTLKFNANLRSCILQKFLEYLTQKKLLNGNEKDEHLLAEIDGGEIEAVGGEILSMIPQPVLESLDVGIRLNIINEIGKLQMMELFGIVPLETLQWYGNTLFRDIVVTAGQSEDTTGRQRRESTTNDTAASEPTPEIDSPDDVITEDVDDDGSPSQQGPPTAGTIGDLVDLRNTESVQTQNDTSTNATEVPLDPQVNSTPTKIGKVLLSFPHGFNGEALNSLGNLLCYADSIFDNTWPRSLLKDVLEAKTSVGEKTCCLQRSFRNKWFQALKEVYGSDTSTWNEFDLASIGDLLIVLPEKELQTISTDSLSKALTPMLRQSAFSTKIYIPGETKRIQFIKACTDALGKEGEDFMGQYKIFMRRLFQAAQWQINTVKTTQELIRDGVGRTGRIPRWAEHTLVKRQVPLTTQGTGDISYGGLTSPVATAVPMTTAPAYYPTMAYAPQMVQPNYAMQMPQYMPQPVMYAPPAYAPQAYAPQYVAYPGYAPQIMAPMATQPMGFAPQAVFAQPGIQQQTPGVGGATAATTAGTGGAAGAAGAGGSFPGTSSVAQTTANNANAFAQGGTDPISQADANTLAARAVGNQQAPQQQQPQQQQQQQSPQPQQNPAGPQTGNTAPPPQQNAPAQQQPVNPPPPVQPQQTPAQQQPQGPPPPSPAQQSPSGPSSSPPGQTGPANPTGPQQPLTQAGQPQKPGSGSGNVQAFPPNSGQAAPPSQSPNSANNPGNVFPGSERLRSINFGALQDETHTSEITCHGIKAAGDAAIGLTMEDLDKLSQADLFDCVEALGKIEWDDDSKSRIVTLLKQKLDFTHEAINAMTLIELGNLVTAFSAKDDGEDSSTSSSGGNSTVHSDISMIDLTLPLSLDVLSILGQQIKEPTLLKALAEKFNQDNKIFPGFGESIARPENLRIVVMSLGNIICGLSDKIVNSIFETDATLFIDTSRVLGKLDGCSSGVLSTLAAHAVRPSNYGPPRLWSQEDVESIGVVVAGLKPDAISSIPSEAMQGLTSLAVKNLPAQNILSLSSEQLQKLSYDAAKAFTQSQLNNLSPTSIDALKPVLEVQADIFNIPTPPQDTQDADASREEVLRNLPGMSENETEGIGGRSKDAKPTPAPETTTTTTAEPTTTTPVTISTETKTTSTSALPSKSASFSLVSCYLSLLAIFIPVIHSMNI